MKSWWSSSPNISTNPELPPHEPRAVLARGIFVTFAVILPKYRASCAFSARSGRPRAPWYFSNGSLAPPAVGRCFAHSLSMAGANSALPSTHSFLCACLGRAISRAVPVSLTRPPTSWFRSQLSPPANLRSHRSTRPNTIHRTPKLSDLALFLQFPADPHFSRLISMGE